MSIDLKSIRPAAPGDINDMAALDAICFATPWTLGDFDTEINSNRLARYLVWEYDGRTIAYAGLWAVPPEGHITNVAVHPEFCGRGIATALVSELLRRTANADGLSEFTLEVREGNAAARALYEKLGFKPEGRRKRYYADTGEDALLLWKRIC